MAALTKSIYLAWSKARLSKKEISFHAELANARNILLRLAEKAPHTLFSLYTAAALKKSKKTRKLTVLCPQDAELPPLESNNLFERRIDIAETPFYGSKSFKTLKEQLAKSSFDLFVDLDPSPLPELAILSAATLRITYQDKELFPYFNILLAPDERANLHKRAQSMGKYLACEGNVEEALPNPQVSQRKANDWLRDHGHRSGRKLPYLLSSAALGAESLAGIKVFEAEAWSGEDAETKASLIASAAAYVGKPDRAFELAYLLATPCVVVLDDKTPGINLPSSARIKVIKVSKGTSPLEAINQALTSISP